MKKYIALFIGLLNAVHVFAGGAESPEQLSESFIAAVNARDMTSMRELVHPACLADLSEGQRQFMQETLERDFRKAIPPERRIKISELDNDALPFADMVDWPANPTHRLDIDFGKLDAAVGKYSGTTIVRFIAKKKDQSYSITKTWKSTSSISNPRDRLKHNKRSSMYIKRFITIAFIMPLFLYRRT